MAPPLHPSLHRTGPQSRRCRRTGVGSELDPMRVSQTIARPAPAGAGLVVSSRLALHQRILASCQHCMGKGEDDSEGAMSIAEGKNERKAQLRIRASLTKGVANASSAVHGTAHRANESPTLQRRTTVRRIDRLELNQEDACLSNLPFTLAQHWRWQLPVSVSSLLLLQVLDLTKL